MTVASALVDAHRRPALEVATARRFRNAPGTEVVGLWHPPAEARGPVAILLHGLTGDASAGYMRGLAAALTARGLGVLRLNARNCGGTEHLTDTLYHAGLSVDVKPVARALAADGHRRIGLAGFSMGGNVALKALGEWGPETPREVCAVAAVSPPVDLAAASRSIERGLLNAVYQQSFLRGLRGLAKRKAASHPGLVDPRAAASARTLRAFDDAVVAPAFGCEGADDYYAKASADPWLDRIQVPALVLQAEDDSIVPAHTIRDWVTAHPGRIDLVLSRTRGHVGFVQSRAAARASGGFFWAERRVAEFLANTLYAETSSSEVQ